MSKKIQAYIAKHPEKFDSWHTELDGYGDAHNDHLPSYWVYCKAGYICPENECGSIHTKTVKEALTLMRTVIKGEAHGWTNRETWLVNIWFMDSLDGPTTASYLEEMVDDYIQMTLGESGVSGFISDLLCTSDINWHELAADHNAGFEESEDE